MSRPDAWNQEAVEDALAGNPDSLCDAFIWSTTPQGNAFWCSESLSTELSPEAREILVNWSNEK